MGQAWCNAPLTTEPSCQPSASSLQRNYSYDVKKREISQTFDPVKPLYIWTAHPNCFVITLLLVFLQDSSGNKQRGTLACVSREVV